MKTFTILNKGESIMKLALFNLREDERPFVDAWMKNIRCEIDLHEGELQAETNT